MIFKNQICLQPRYGRLLYDIISEFISKDDYENDQNDFFNNISLIFYTRNKPDSKYSNIYYDKKYYMTMTIDELRDIILKSPNSEFSYELVNNIARYLPLTFFEDMKAFIPSVSYNINIEPRFIPSERDLIILSELGDIEKFINLYKSIIPIYQLRKLIKITLLLNISTIDINNICSMTDDRSFSKFLSKSRDGKIKFSKILYNKSVQDINNIKNESIQSIYMATRNESCLSNDVIYKTVLTRSIEDWSIIANLIGNAYGLDDFYKAIGGYKGIKSVFYWGGDL